MSPTWETYQSGSTVRIRRRPVRHYAAKTKIAPVQEPASAPDYSSLKKDELVAEAEQQGVDSSGTKAEIIERLES